MAKWYYHPIYTSEQQALATGPTGTAIDNAARGRIMDFKNDPDFGNGARVVYSGRWRPTKPLKGVANGDVLTVDGHGQGRVGANDQWEVGPGITTATGTTILTPNDIAGRLRRDGLQNNRVLIKFYACLTGLAPANGDPAAAVLAASLGYTNVVVQGYRGTTIHSTDNRRRVRPSDFGGPKSAHKHRNYFDHTGTEISLVRAQAIAGYQVGHKDRGNAGDIGEMWDNAVDF